MRFNVVVANPPFSLDKWGHVGGRLFTTSFCALMLEVYYRHAPLYAAEAESP